MIEFHLQYRCFQVVMFLMWAGLQMFGVVLIIIICKIVQGPLEEFKKANADAKSSQNEMEMEMEGKQKD